MASAMVRGWVRADAGMAGRLLVTDRGSGRAAALAAKLASATSSATRTSSARPTWWCCA